MSYTVFNASDNKKIFLYRKKRFKEKGKERKECLGRETVKGNGEAWGKINTDVTFS